MAIHPIEFRYGTPEMKAIWEQESKLQNMLKVEAALAKAEAEIGLIPKDAADEINKKATANSSCDKSAVAHNYLCISLFLFYRITII